jgi:hypothetical protein
MYNKPYEPGTPEYQKRKSIYEDRIKKLINAQNSLDINHQVGVNHFTDISDEER